MFHKCYGIGDVQERKVIHVKLILYTAKWSLVIKSTLCVSCHFFAKTHSL